MVVEQLQVSTREGSRDYGAHYYEAEYGRPQYDNRGRDYYSHRGGK